MKNVVQYVCCKPAVPKEPCHVLGDKGECGFRSLVLRGGHRCKRHSTKHRQPADGDVYREQDGKDRE